MVCPHLSYKASLVDTGRLQKYLDGVSSSLNNPTLSACFQGRGVPSLWSALWPSSGPTPTGPYLSCAGNPRARHSTLGRVWAEQSRAEGYNPSLDMLSMLLLLQPWTELPFWAASAHYQVISSLSSTSTPKSLSSELLSVLSFLTLHWYWELPQPKCRTLCLALLNFMKLMPAHFSNCYIHIHAHIHAYICVCIYSVSKSKENNVAQK